MKQLKNIKTRTAMYFIGLFVMTIGIALSVKSNLGVSPVALPISISQTQVIVYGMELTGDTPRFDFTERDCYVLSYRTGVSDCFIKRN